MINDLRFVQQCLWELEAGVLDDPCDLTPDEEAVLFDCPGMTEHRLFELRQSRTYGDTLAFDPDLGVYDWNDPETVSIHEFQPDLDVGDFDDDFIVVFDDDLDYEPTDSLSEAARSLRISTESLNLEMARARAAWDGIQKDLLALKERMKDLQTRLRDRADLLESWRKPDDK